MQTEDQEREMSNDQHIFSGNIFIFQSFDVGDDIELEKLKSSKNLLLRPLRLSKYFKNYHTPLPIDLPHPHESSRFFTANIHGFGVISLSYRIPFEDTLENLRKKLPEIDAEFQEQSVEDASSIFNNIKYAVKEPKFFHLRTSYVVIQVNPQPESLTSTHLKEKYGNEIAALLRFETESLSDYQKNLIIRSDVGYYRGNAMFIDTQASFVYDDEYEELLGIFEFANIQQTELQYFDRLLDQQLNIVYQRETHRLPFWAFLPLFGHLLKDPIGQLGVLKVEISVIVERLKSSIKVAGEDYISEIYRHLVDKLELNTWKDDLDDKLQIIRDLNQIHQHRTDAIREELLTLAILFLIAIELIVAIVKG